MNEYSINPPAEPNKHNIDTKLVYCDNAPNRLIILHVLLQLQHWRATR